MLSPPTRLRSTNEYFNKVPSTKVKTYGQCKYVIAGAKQTSYGAVKNNFCSFPLSSQNVTAAPDFPQLDQKTKSAQTWSLRAQMSNVIIGPTLWPFLRANPRHQRYARSCRNRVPVQLHGLQVSRPGFE